jgi:hypothetical protein
MVLLLVVGLAAVIIVILIAVFLSVRLGRSDDHDEPMGRSSERGRGRPDADDDPGWRDERAPRRSPAGVGSPAPGRGQRPRPHGQDRRYRDGDGPGPVTTTTSSGGPGATTRGRWSSRPTPGGR